MKEKVKIEAARKFAEFWKNKGYEKGESQTFWISLLRDICGIDRPEEFISFEDQVHIDHTSFIDGFIRSTHVLVEQKSINKELNKGIRQSDGSFLSPFQQAKRYSSELPYSERPRWIVTSNFRQFYIYDMEKPQGEPEIILLENLSKEYYRLDFLTNPGNDHIKQEMAVSIKAGELVGFIYDAFSKQYNDIRNLSSARSLNMLCVRLVFCLYAEDAGLFGRRNMFHDYLKSFDARNMRTALVNLFRILDTKTEDRDPYLEGDLTEFPYVNGGLFEDETIEIPHITDEIRSLLLTHASNDFDWSVISPTIFGAVFESTLNPETRRSGGMHYTSIENIHKVIDPLFLDDLKDELSKIKEIQVFGVREKKLKDYRIKLASLSFLDPAAGSGNFLTETYLSLRKLENEALTFEVKNGQKQLGFENESSPIKVSIQQFFGIEINDYAVSVAKTALWIAESQMKRETEKIIHMDLEFLPLDAYTNIQEGNSLRMNWLDVAPKGVINYIMGNPPFVGSKYSSESQKSDMDIAFSENSRKFRKLDYVTTWFYIAAKYMQNTNIKCAFVSTNSICQGEQVDIFWPLMFDKGVKIDFAYQTFRWDSEASDMAHVHCIIIGFSGVHVKTRKYIYCGDRVLFVENINAYLNDGPNVIIKSRNTPIKADILPMIASNKPCDYNNLKIEPSEYLEFMRKCPDSKKWIKKMVGAQEFINNKERYCLWLVSCSPSELKSMPMVFDRVEKCKLARIKANTPESIKLSNTPTLFREQINPKNYLIIPCVSSESRKYIPMGFLNEDTIPVMGTLIIENADDYYFGILTSNVHMAWMRAVSGKLKSDYRYSKDIVYNNFPWPTVSDEQKAQIEETAKLILSARALFPDSTLADLYDDIAMPSELRIAHQKNDRVVMNAYGFSVKMTESECVVELMKKYQKLDSSK